MSGEWVLWGSNPAYADGVGIKITGGALSHCRTERRWREQDGGWSGLAILKPGTPYVSVNGQQGGGKR